MKRPSIASTTAPLAAALLATALLATAAMASTTAHADSMTFVWQQLSGTTPASGSLTLTSSLLTPSDATGAAQFSLMLAQITAAGETVLGDVSAFSFSFGGRSLATADMTANSTGWADMFPGEPNNILESTWSASHTFGGGASGTLRAADTQAHKA